MSGIKKMKMETPNRCLFWHRWTMMKDTGSTEYYQCKDCGSRFAQSTSTGYQPINYRWVSGFEDEFRSQS